MTSQMSTGGNSTSLVASKALSRKKSHFSAIYTASGKQRCGSTLALYLEQYDDYEKGKNWTNSTYYIEIIQITRDYGLRSHLQIS